MKYKPFEAAENSRLAATNLFQFLPWITGLMLLSVVFTWFAWNVDYFRSIQISAETETAKIAELRLIISTISAFFAVSVLAWLAMVLNLQKSRQTISRQIAEKGKNETSLRNSAQYENLFRHANDAILIFEPDTEILLEVNDKACEIYARRREDFIGHSLKEMSQNAARGTNELEKLLHDGVCDEFESVHLRGDGEPINLVINAAVIEYHGRRAVLTINRDVTVKKQMEIALRESEEQFRSVTRSAQDAIISADSRGNIIFWNKGAEKMFGYATEEVIGQSLHIIMPAAQVAAHQKGLERNVRTGENRLVGKTVEVPGRRQDGTEFPLELSLGTWETAKGKFFTAVIRDITSRKQAEDAVIKSERNYRLLAEGIKHQVWTATPGGKLDYVNGRTLEYCGRTKEEAVGDQWTDAIHPEDLPVCREYWMRSLKTGEDYEHEVRLRAADGSYRWHSGRATAGRDAEGRIVKWFGTNTDIHEQKLKEGLQKNLALLSSAFEAAAGGILVVNTNNKIEMFNRQFAKMWGLTSDALKHFASAGTPQIVLEQIKDSKRYLEQIKQIGVHSDEIHLDEVELKNGLVYERHSRPQKLNGAVIGRVFNFRDITEQKRAQKNLRESEEWLKALLDASRDGIVVEDDGIIVYVNRSYTRQLKYDKPEELIGKHISDILPPVEAERLSEYGRRRLRDEDCPSVYEFNALCQDGTTVEVEAAVSSCVIGGKKYIMTSLRDIAERKDAEKALQNSEKRFRSFMNNNPAVAFMKDDAGRYVFGNETMERMFEISMADLVGKTDFDWLPANVAEQLHANDQKVLESNQTVQVLETVPLPNGTSRSWLAFKFPVADASGKKFLGGVTIDVTEREQAERALRESEYKLRTLLENMSEGLLQVDEADSIQFANKCFCQMTGYSSEDLVGKNWSELLLDDEAREIIKQVNRRRRDGVSDHYELRLRRQTGEIIWTTVGGVPLYDEAGCVVGSMGVFTDITERKRIEDQLLHDAFHDGLTGLANRALFMDHLQRTITRNKNRRNDFYAVLFLDFDRFKVINDSLGHLVGDNFLQMVSRRLEHSTRAGDLVARLGGDEFVMLLSELQEPSDAIAIAERIQEDLKTPIVLSGREIFISVSIGIALSVAGHRKAADMLRDADIAMYHAKAKGRARYQVFDRQMHEQASRQLSLETEMHHALERREFEVHYQPIINLKNETLTGFEALVRWRHPQRGLIPPLEFIPAAEESNLILPLGNWILEESCRQLRQWQNDFQAARRLTISVNLSSKQFAQTDLIEQITRALKRTNLDPRCLKLEITESHVMENSEQAIRMMNRLRSLGVELSLDDFGTGYSSLSYLHRLPASYLKIDRSFVMRMTDSEEHGEIVSTIIKLAQNLKMKVVAEGIETSEQLTHLKKLNCEFGQGYFFSKPLEAENAKSYINRTFAF